VLPRLREESRLLADREQIDMSARFGAVPQDAADPNGQVRKRQAGFDPLVENGTDPRDRLAHEVAALALCDPVCNLSAHIRPREPPGNPGRFSSASS
jgi:hypothetical protein